MARPPDRAQRAYADSNLLLALFAEAEHPSHAAATALFARVVRRELRLIVTPVVVAEVVWAARRTFGWSPAQAATVLRDALEADGLDVIERASVFAALDLQITEPQLDFVDAYLAAIARTLGPAVIASFDRDFDRVTGIERISR